MISSLDPRTEIHIYIYKYIQYIYHMEIEMSSKALAKDLLQVTPSKNNFKILSRQPAPVAASVQSGFCFET